MADATFRKLLELMDTDRPADIRQAAALVLGELGGQDAAAGRMLCDALDDPDPAFRAPVLRSVGRLRVERALPKLLRIVSQGGTEAEAAAQAAAALGTKGIDGLRELMRGAAPGLRRRIAGALGSGGTVSAETAAVSALLDADAGVVDAAARSLISQVPALDAKHRRTLADGVLELLKDKKAERRPASEAALLRLLAALNDPRAEAVFWARTEAKVPAELRATALQALGALPTPTATDKIARLLECGASADFRVAAPALMILKAVPVGERALKPWLRLLDAPDIATRRLAIDKLQGKENAELATALVRQLQQADRGLREMALAELGRTKAGRAELVRELLRASDPDAAWTLARAQAHFAAELEAELRGQLFARACEWVDEGDRRADALWFLLREADARQMRDWIEERAVALRKKKEYEAAMPYFRLLTRDPACGEVMRFEAAACALRLSAHDLAAEARAADTALHQFAALLHRHETEPIRYVEKAKWLEAEDLFYLGFHFVEGARAEKVFGGQVLKVLMERWPRTKLAKDARSKLRSQGLS